MKIALLMKDGFEELEALGIVDMARRLNVQCDIVGFEKEYMKSSHNVYIKTDMDFSQLDNSYDALVLPGGPAAKSLKSDHRVIELIQKYNDNNKIVAAICAAPIALEKAGVIKGKTVTSYPTVKGELVSANYEFATVQVDGNIITGNGPAATFAFAFAILEALGLDTNAVKEGTQYHYLIQKR